MKRIEVVAAIIHHEGKYLATQRGYGEFKGGWEFPGGKIEPEESREEALIREIREELRMEIVPERWLCTTEHDYTTFHLTMHCYLCRRGRADWPFGSNFVDGIAGYENIDDLFYVFFYSSSATACGR